MLELQPYRHRLLSLRERARGLMSGAVRNVKETGVETAIRTSLVSMTSFGFGVLQGRFADKGGASLFGLPAELLVGVTFHALALFGLGGSGAKYLHSFGDGAMAAFFNTAGYRVGDNWRKKGGSISGLFGDSAPKGITGGSSIADSVMADLAMAD